MSAAGHAAAFVTGETARFAAFLLTLHAVLFALVSLLPPVAGGLLGWAADDRAAVERINRDLGLDGPWYRRYGTHLSAVLHGDLGLSTRGRFPVSEVLGRGLVRSTPIFTASACGCALGLAGAAWAFIPARRPRVRRLLRTAGAVGFLPPFVSALVAAAVYETALTRAVLPVPATALYWACLLTAAAAFPFALTFAAAGRAAEALAVTDHVRAHRALGAGWTRVRWRATANLLDALRPQLGRVIIAALLSTGFCELLFGVAGFGRAGLSAFRASDFPMLFGWMLTAGAITYALSRITQWHRRSSADEPSLS